MLLYTLFNIVALITQVIVMLVIVQFIIGLLFSFNVVSSSNEFLFQVYRSINSLLDPLLRPIRNFLPSAGAIDFSPLVLIVGLQIFMIILEGLMRST